MFAASGTQPTNHPGTVSISGTPTQNQILTATVSDADGLPGSITYQWQRSTDGTTWSNITGATASTLTLGQAQVGGFIRVSAVYTDSLGSSETPVSAATATKVANVNDIGIVTINGTATQNQTLTTSVADPDGVPASITYRWQSSPDGTTWTNLSATTASLTLDSSLVGKRIRVNATYTDQLGTAENATSAATATVGAASATTTLFTTQTPVNTNATDGTGADYELGMRFTSDASGVIQAIRYYKASNETGTHIGHIWSATGQELATVTFTNEGASGWQQQTLATPLTIAAGTTYVVSVNINSYYVSTTQGFASGISNGGLNAPVGAGVFDYTEGAFPTATYQNANYFRDVVFAASGTQPTNHPGTVSVSGTPTQNQTLTATVSDADGLPGSITYQWQRSTDGTTWSNITGATASTLTLGQAQVGGFIRVSAVYTDSLGSSETPVSAATATKVANVNDIGIVTINGTATQNQTLTTSVADPDGVPASITYRWQSSPDGTTWTNLSATTASLTLDSSLVGKRIRVNATYTDQLGTAENATSAATATVGAASATTTLFTTQTPVNTNATDGTGADYELGMRFTSDASGVIQAIRYYKASNETGTHIGHIWSATGQELATVTFTNEGASGWQQQTLATPLTIAAGTTYVVSVNINSYYVSTTQGFASGISNGGLNAPVGAGVFDYTEGAFPTATYQNANYFRDVVFAPSNVIALLNTSTIYVSEAAGTATITVTRSGDLQSQNTVEYTTNEIGTGGTATAGSDFIQPTFNGRANTGQIVFAPGESTKSFTISIVNDQLTEGNETFAVGIQNPGSGSLGAPRTVLVTIIDDDSPASIAMADVAVSVAESTPTAAITLLRSGNVNQAATVGFTTSNGSALAGSDYTTSSGTVTFAAGQVSQTISVPIVNDTTPENDETFTVTLSNPTGATLGPQATTTVKILDNDNPALGNLVGETAVTGLNEPAAMDWTPDGRYMLVAQKDGVVRVVDNGTLRSTPLIDLSAEVNDFGDRGLLGIAVNPNFASNHYVYLLYTYDPPETAGQSGLAAADQGGNRPDRLVRVTVDPTTMIADPSSEVVLVGKNSVWAYISRPDANSGGDPSIVPSGIVNGTTITAPASQIEVGSQDNDPDRPGIQNQNIRDYLATDSDSHSIGAVHFGPDGYLYLTVGDGTSYNFVDPRAVRVQDIHNLSGKLLRIDPVTGEGAPGNPYYQAGDPNSNQSKVFYYGVRNAYRFSFDPVTNLPVVGDVGWNNWEEIDTGPAGSNFGWPYLEGPDRTASYQNLPQAITFYNNGNRNNTSDPAAVFPILPLSHGAPDNAHVITVGDFYNQNTMFFDDVYNGTIFAATLNASRQVAGVQLVDNVQGIVDLQKGPDGWLYGADIYDGTIRRWVDSSAAAGSTLGLAAS
ncbi:glucose/arabinose dehydrogenase [Bradyrhizobium sp. LM3.6]